MSAAHFLGKRKNLKGKAFEKLLMVKVRKAAKQIPKDITMGYISNPDALFISDKINTGNILSQLADFIKVVTIPMDSIENDFKKLKRLKLDYLYADICNFNIQPFILREKHYNTLPFVIWLHTVYGWLEWIVKIVPLIKKEDIIVAPSEYAKKMFLRITDRYKVNVIPFCLDIKYIRGNIEQRRNSDKKIISFMGRLKEDKGVGLIIECMPQIIKKVRNAQLNIIGPLSGHEIKDFPESSYVTELKRKVRCWKLKKNICFKGVRFGLDKYNLLSQSDVFVNLTLAKEEGLTVVNLEALACGVPVITTDWASNKEVIADNKNGYLVNVYNDKNNNYKIDKEKAIQLIITLLMDNKHSRRLAGCAKETASYYHYKYVMPRLIKLLKKKGAYKGGNRWNLIKNKKLRDFSGLYNKEMLFFIGVLGWANMRYSNPCENEAELTFIKRAEGRKDEDFNSIAFRKKIFNDLWLYLSQ